MFLVSCIKMPISAEQKLRIDLIDNEDYSSVMRKVRDEHVCKHNYEPSQEYLDKGLFGLKQYYVLSLLDPMNSHTVSEVVDPFWHFHIIHTHQYDYFCRKVFGAFLHHIPLDKQDQDQMENIAVVYDYTLETLTAIFGVPNPEIWAKGTQANFICWGDSRSGINKGIEALALFPANERGVSRYAQKLQQQFSMA